MADKEKILIIDSDEAYASSLQEALSKNIDADVYIEPDPNKALLRLISKTEEFAVVLIDIRTPIVDSLDSLKLIRESEIKHPVVFLTGCPIDLKDEKQMSGFIFKSEESIHISLLINRVKLFIDNKKFIKKKQADQEKKCKHLFDNAPISLWQEDISEVKKMLQSLENDIGKENIPSFLDSHPNFVIKAVSGIKIKNVNKATLQLFEADSIEQLRNSINITFSEQSYELFKKYMCLLSNNLNSTKLETTFKTLKGNEIECIVGLLSPPDTHNESNELIVSMVDITKIKKLEKQEADLKSFIAKSPIVAFQLKCSPNWPVEFMSEKSIDLFGYSPEDFTSGRISWVSINHHEDLAVVENEIASYVKNNSKEDLHIQCRILTAKGEIKWVNVVANIKYNLHNKPISVSGIMYDVTKEVKTQKKIIESTEKWKMLIESTKTAYLILNEKGNIIDANQLAFSLIGSESNEILKQNFRLFISPESVSRYDNAIHLLLNGENIENLELGVKPNNFWKSKVSWIRLSAGLIENGEKKLFFLMQDITAIKIEESKKFINDQKQRDKLKQHILRIREGLIKGEI
jgi:PAS domain S-box-containing protein